MNPGMTDPLRVLHIVPHLRAGGAAGSLTTTARLLAADGFAANHRVLPLEPILSPLVRIDLGRAGVTLLPGIEVEAAAIAASDVVILHFWNTPHTLAWLDRVPPRVPVVAWIKVAGTAAPQLVPPALVGRVDRILLTATCTAGLPPIHGWQGPLPPVEVIRGIADFTAAAAVRPVRHDGFVVTYVGTVGLGKIHPDFVALSLSAALPDARFVVCGSGGGETALAQAAEAAAAGGRFDLLGYVRDLRPVLAGSDVFGYPLAPDTYSSSDRSLQEAMFAGVPPVILRHGGIADMVEHGVSGLVVDEADYGAALAHLHADGDQRRRLAEGAAAHARRHFDALRSVRRLAAILAEAASAGTTRPAPPITDDPFPAARRFSEAMGVAGEALRTSLSGDAGSDAADAIIQRLPADAVRVEGGLFHQRNGAPADGMLRYWTGLVLAAEGRAEAADREFSAAIAAGAAVDRARARLAREPDGD